MGLAWLPLLLCFVITSTILTTYYISIFNGHVNPEFPLISYTGSYPPESCIFSLGLNMTAILSGICVCIWHLICWNHTELLEKCQPRILLKVTLIFGLISSVGISLVGNFQQSFVKTVHMIGAGMGFGGSTIYIFLVTHICRTYLGYPVCYWVYRLLVGLGSLVLCIGFFIGRALARKGFLPGRDDTITFRTPDDGGWVANTGSAICEWTMTLFLVLFFLSWAPEFMNYAIDSSKGVHCISKGFPRISDLRCPKRYQKSLEKN